MGALLGRKEENPLPEATSDSILAEEFAGYFHDKIDNIRSRFTTITPYKPEERSKVPLLDMFTPISEMQLEKTITRMSSKTCALDIIPTARLKEGTRHYPTISNTHSKQVTSSGRILQQLEGSTSQTTSKE